MEPTSIKTSLNILTFSLSRRKEFSPGHARHAQFLQNSKLFKCLQAFGAQCCTRGRASNWKVCNDWPVSPGANCLIFPQEEAEGLKSCWTGEGKIFRDWCQSSDARDMKLRISSLVSWAGQLEETSNIKQSLAQELGCQPLRTQAKGRLHQVYLIMQYS